MHRAGSMQGSVLLLQGTEDRSGAARPGRGHARRPGRGRDRCDLEFFAGEGHGFRRADTLTACLEAELAFYLRQLAPLGCARGVPSSSPPVVRGFCDAMLTHSATTIPSPGGPLGRLLAAGGRPRQGDLPGARRRPAVRGQRPVRAPHHLHVDQRPLPGLGADGLAPVRLRCGGLGSAGLGRAPCPPPAARTGPDAAPAPARLADPDRVRRVRVRRLPGHPPRLRDPVAVRRCRRIAPAA